MRDEGPIAAAESASPYFSTATEATVPVHCDMVSAQLAVLACTHRGGRPENQDRFLIDPKRNLLVVADGVGGLREGGLAAELTCKTIHSDVSAGLPLDRAVRRCSGVIAKEATLRGVVGGMGSTVVALQWQDARFQLVWVGDSSARTYWEECCHRLTRDHSEAAEWATQGILTESASLGHPRKHVLTQALGVTAGSELRLGRNEGVLRAGEWLLLSSDGVTNTLTSEEIAAQLDDTKNVEAAGRSLMESVLAGEPSDNATLVLGRWSGPSATPADLPRVYPA
jgi:serine/threonine protein phosphatase PrpC